METIYKYDAHIIDTFKIFMPYGAEVLCVQMQQGVPRIWARVNTTALIVPYEFSWRGTGDDVFSLGRYIGTVQELSLVYHLFEKARRQ
jgi:hypothetical protein